MRIACVQLSADLFKVVTLGFCWLKVEFHSYFKFVYPIAHYFVIDYGFKTWECNCEWWPNDDKMTTMKSILKFFFCKLCWNKISLNSKTSLRYGRTAVNSRNFKLIIIVKGFSSQEKRFRLVQREKADDLVQGRFRPIYMGKLSQ